MTTRFIDPDLGKPAEQLFGERIKRMTDALQLKQPDRIPIHCGWVTCSPKCTASPARNSTKTATRSSRCCSRPRCISSRTASWACSTTPRPALAIGGDRMTKLPGHGLDANGSFQFVEDEYMKPEDYDAFIEDPADWSIRKYWPRVFPELEGLAHAAAAGHGCVRHLQPVQPRPLAPPVAKALQMLAKRADAQAGRDARAGEIVQRLAALGFPPPTLARLLHRSAVRLHVRHPARHARHHARHSPPPGEAAGRRGESPPLPA